MAKKAKKSKSTNSPEYDALLKQYRTLAKRADQRMVRLEKLSATDPLFEGATGFAYKGAKKAAEEWGSKGALPRFNIKPPKDIRNLRAKITDIERFLHSKTSTKQDIKKTYIARTKALNKTWDTNFTWEEVAILLNKGILSKSDTNYGSKTLMRAVDVITQNRLNAKNVDDKLADLKESLEEDKSTKLIKPDEVETEVIKNLLSQGLDYDRLF